jgi:hypothetical protein
MVTGIVALMVSEELFLLSQTTGARGTDLSPLFSNFLFPNLFSIKFLYFFIISSLSPYFNLCQYLYNLMLTSNCMCRPYIDTNFLACVTNMKIVGYS